MNQMIQHIQDGMIKKLAAARKNIESDKEISAGLYTYVLEELGKMLLLKKSELNDDKYVVRYAEEFVCHSKKFTNAFDYLSEKGHGQCITINEGDFNAKDYNWHDFEVGLLRICSVYTYVYTYHILLSKILDHATTMTMTITIHHDITTTTYMLH